MMTRTPSKTSLAVLLVLACATLPLVGPTVAHADGTSAVSPPGAPAPAAAPAPASPLPNVTQVVTQVQNFYNKTRSFKSDFEQTFVVKAYNMTKRSKGQVTFLKPGKMDWTYADPAGNRVVSDGTTLKVYEEANKQVYEQPVAGSQYPAALSFLTGQGELSSSFNFTLYEGDGQFQFPGGYVLVGEPKTPTAAYTKVLFYVDKQTFQIRRVLIVDGQSNRNRFDFVNPQVNMTVDPNQFVFVAPPNTTVVRP